uniref:Uncharacterized protein n=1 Tax=Siphoviridae sp. ctj7g1 TaxID=2826438 RepID=A0A8S5R1S6_9CAUD|nr:MAG TPA: hypothetical protein [Siphoviridae sp. ctj7g1]
MTPLGPLLYILYIKIYNSSNVAMGAGCTRTNKEF